MEKDKAKYAYEASQAVVEATMGVGGYNELVVPMAHGYWPGMLHILKVTRFQTGLAIY